MADEMERYLSGAALYGDDLDDEVIAAWFTDEAKGYYNLSAGSAQERAEYQVLNDMTLFRHVAGKALGTCVSLGSASGFDIERLAGQVDRFVIVEPTREFWKETIGGRPASYRLPQLRGHIDLEESSTGIVTAIGVLHHIPNVSDILREVYRVLKPGGYLLLREPVVSMGDWRLPRVGLTQNERGIPSAWLISKLQEIGFRLECVTPCIFGPLPRVFNRFGILPYQTWWTTLLDLAISRLTRWNSTYHRRGFFRKFAPAGIAVVAKK